MLFKLIGGRHSEGDKTYHKDQIVPSDRDLEAIFAGKFVCVDRDHVCTKEAPVLSEEEPSGLVTDHEVLDTVDASDVDIEGEPANHLFPDVPADKFLIWKLPGGWYNITETEVPNVVLNPNRLRKVGVMDYLQENELI